MTKHDTWVQLSPDSPYSEILGLFPDGVPMRDPFPMERATENGRTVSLQITDNDRLTDTQFNALASCIARQRNAVVWDVMAEAIDKGGFAINHVWIIAMNCGPEGMQRTKELADFLENAPQPPSAKALQDFLEDQINRWVLGDSVPPPLPEKVEDWDQRLVTPELEQALKEQQIKKKLANYSVFDVLTGKAMVDILNEIDPDNNYEIASDLDDE